MKSRRKPLKALGPLKATACHLFQAPQDALFIWCSSGWRCCGAHPAERMSYHSAPWQTQVLYGGTVTITHYHCGLIFLIEVNSLLMSHSNDVMRQGIDFGGRIYFNHLVKDFSPVFIESQRAWEGHFNYSVRVDCILWGKLSARVGLGVGGD